MKIRFKLRDYGCWLSRRKSSACGNASESHDLNHSRITTYNLTKSRVGENKVDYNKTSAQKHAVSVTFGTTIHSGALHDPPTHTNKRKTRQHSTPPRGEIVEQHSHPALVASRLRESSLSPCERTWPHSANEVYEFNARPLASTSTTLTWTDAWSLEVIRRSATHAHWIVSEHSSLAKHLLVAAHLRGT